MRFHARALAAAIGIGAYVAAAASGPHAQIQPSNSPTISTGTWTALAHQPPVAITNCLLLTDGRVMCQRYGSNAWYTLTPDSSGSYINGTWTQIASMASGYDPIYFASAVLADGR